MQQNRLAFFLLFYLCGTPTIGEATVELRLMTVVTIPEGLPTFKLPVVATGQATDGFSVTFLLSGTAVLDEDYTVLTPTTVTWTAAEQQDGVSAKYIEIETIEDGVADTMENIIVTLSSPVNCVVGSYNEMTVLIADVTHYPNGHFIVKDVVSGGAKGDLVSVTVERLGGTTGSVDVTLGDRDDLDPEVTRGTQYSINGPAQLTFAAGETQKTFDNVYRLIDDGQQTPQPQFFAVSVDSVTLNAEAVSQFYQFVYITEASQATGDPHVALYVNGVLLPVCFDLKGAEGQSVMLVKNAEFALSGTFRGDNYFKAINVTVNRNEYYFTTDEFQVGDKKKSWEKDEKEVRYAELIDDGQARVTGSSCSVVIEKVDGENGGAFLNFYVESIDENAAGGIVGSILTTHYQLKEMNGAGILTSSNGIATAKKETKFGQECWFVEEQGEKLYPNERSYYNM